MAKEKRDEIPKRRSTTYVCVPPGPGQREYAIRRVDVYDAPNGFRFDSEEVVRHPSMLVVRERLRVLLEGVVP